MAQTSPTARALVQEGIALYDQGQYEQAVAKYQQALAAEPDDLRTQTELALTYNALRRYPEAAALCHRLLKTHPSADPLLYITYGNSLDSNHQPAQALAAYQQGIKYFPGSFMLYYNQAVALVGQQRPTEAVASLQHAAVLRPTHASTQLALGTVQLQQRARIAGVLALARFLVLEPTGARATQFLPQLDQAMMQGVSQQDEHHITINVAAESLKKGKGQQADDFAPEEMLLSLTGAQAFDEKHRGMTKTEKFIDQFGTLCSVLSERTKLDSKGFNRQYYAPYFVALQKKGFVPAFAYLIHSSQADALDMQQWLAAHPTEVEVFQEWSKTYEWPALKL